MKADNTRIGGITVVVAFVAFVFWMRSSSSGEGAAAEVYCVPSSANTFTCSVKANADLRACWNVVVTCAGKPSTARRCSDVVKAGGTSSFSVTGFSPPIPTTITCDSVKVDGLQVTPQ